MKKLLVSILTICLLTFAVFAQTADLPSFKKGESYTSVRRKMLKAGWKPFHSPNADECAKGDLRCENRPEMESCAGTGLGPCNFLWKRNKKTVTITTVGENKAVYSGHTLN